MDYIDVQLFFGFPVADDAAKRLDVLDPSFYRLYVGEGDHYLQHISYQGKNFLGKAVGNKVEIAKLELLQLNIYSLLKKLLPEYPFERTPLQLIPVLHTPS